MREAGGPVRGAETSVEKLQSGGKARSPKITSAMQGNLEFAEDRSIHHSTKILRSCKVGKHIRSIARKEDGLLLECRLEQAFVRFMERIHKILSIERKISQRIYVVRGEPDHVCPEIWTKIGESRSESKRRMANEKPKLDNARKLRGIYLLH